MGIRSEQVAGRRWPKANQPPDSFKTSGGLDITIAQNAVQG